MSKSADEVLGRVRDILMDEGGIYWPVENLLEFLNDGQREIVNVRPDAMTVVVVAQLDPGDRQTIPTDGIRFVEMPRNLRALPRLSVHVESGNEGEGAVGTPGVGGNGGSIVHPEGNSGATNFTFTITRDLLGYGEGTTTVNYVVTGSGGNPANAADFVGGALPSGTITFAPDETSKTLTIAVQGDTDVEQDEGFTITLSSPTNGEIVVGTVTSTIKNDDTAPPPPPGGTGDPGDPMSLGADFLIATYYFTAENGTDLDTMSRINAPEGAATTSYIGYFMEDRTGHIPWMDWGGDNYGHGVEAIVIYAKTINDAYPGQDIDVELRCYWYGTPVDGNMSMVIDAYLGGTVSKVGYGFVNEGGTKVATITRSKHITTRYPAGGELVGIFRYNRQTQLFEWLP